MMLPMSDHTDGNGQPPQRQCLIRFQLDRDSRGPWCSGFVSTEWLMKRPPQTLGRTATISDPQGKLCYVRRGVNISSSVAADGETNQSPIIAKIPVGAMVTVLVSYIDRQRKLARSMIAFEIEQKMLIGWVNTNKLYIFSGEAVAQRAQAAVKDIQAGKAKTMYMHRLPDHTATQRVVPPIKHTFGRLKGCAFCRPMPSGGKPCFYLDCSSFVYELLVDVASGHQAVDGSREHPGGIVHGPVAALDFAHFNGIPSPHNRLPFVRAFDFAMFFRSQQNVEEVMPGNWGRVRDARDIKPGDIIAFANIAKDARHTGHVWIAVSIPTSDGEYESIEATTKGGKGEEYNTNGGVRSWPRNIKGIIDVPGAKLYGIGRIC